MNQSNLIIAHRGIHNNKTIVENSLSAFKKAITLKIPIELDIQITKDDVIVAFHDNNLKRLTGLNKKVRDIKFEEIENLSLLNTKDRIPTLEEVLQLVNGKVLLNIEIKKTNSYKRLIDNLMGILNEYSGKYIIQSFDYRQLIYIKKRYPNVITGIIISNSKPKIVNFINITVLSKLWHIDFISISKRLVYNKRYIKLINKYPTFIWTINDKKELDKYMNNYTGYICNNLPYNK